MKYEVCIHDDGTSGIRIRGGGEAMHSGMDPLLQANILYVSQTCLEELFKLHREVIVWDVGMGAAVNAAAVLQFAKEKGAKLRMCSFERDLSSLTLALSYRSQFPHLDGLPVEEILTDSEWSDGEGRYWQLLRGDFSTTLFEAPPPQVILWDPFSFKTEGEMWSYQIFQTLTEVIETRSAILSSYSSATRFRGALLSLGWTIGHGMSLTKRSESTVAVRGGDYQRCVKNPVGRKFFEKFSNSHTPFPSDFENPDKERLRLLAQYGFLPTK